MRKFNLLILWLFAILSLANSAMSNSDFLKANGKVLKNNYGNGSTVYLRGTNAGNIAIQEPWMCVTQGTDNVKCERDIYNVLTNRFGADGAKTLLNAYRDNYFTTSDFDKIASWGMNCIRLPLWYRDFTDDNGNLNSDAFVWLDWFVEQASNRGIYVIIDMHGAYGSQNGRDHSGACANNDNSWDEIWASEFFFGNNAANNQEKYYQLWEKIADHYKGNPAVAGYDILNEPFCTYRYSNYEVNGTTWNETNLHNLLWDIYDKAYDRIRAKDPDHIIIMEATWDPWDLPNPNDWGWTNVMYEYHQYEYSDYDNNEGKQITGIQNKINNINNQNHNVPSFIGEFCFFNQTSTWATGLQLMNNAGLHWTSWSYKCISSYGNWGLMNENSGKINLETASYDQILAKWSGLSSASWENTGLTNTVKNYTPGTVTSSVTIPAGDYYITAFGDKIVTNNGTNPLIANGNATYGGTNNEKITVVVNADGTVSFKSNVNNNYVCAVADENSQLLARSTAINDWEKFYLVPTGTTNQYGIKAVANGNYVKADFDDANNNGQLKAVSTTVSGWEAFTFTPISLNVTTVNCPGSFSVADYSFKSESITINQNGGNTYAGNLTAGTYLEYTVNVATAGTYYLNLELATTGVDRTLFISIDGTSVGTYTPTAGNDWFTFTNYSVAFNFTAGIHTLRITPSAGINITNPSFTVYEEGQGGGGESSDECGTVVVSGGSSSGNLRVVGYLPDWESGDWNKIDYSALTHCVFAFLTYDANGNFGWWINDSYMTSAVNSCKANGVKTLIALGGGGGFNTNGNPFGTQAKRAHIINKLVDFVNQYGLDGVDIDIEINSSDAIWNNFDSFVQELRTALGNDKLITMAVGEWFTGAISNTTFRRLDFLNVMAYDYAFGDGPVAPKDQCDAMMGRYAQKMGDASKVTYGIPFYGYSNGGVTRDWSEIISLNADNLNRDYDPNNGIYYNGVPTIKSKIETSKEYGGIMIWQLAEDDFGSNSMLKVVKDNIGSGKQIVATNIPCTVAISNYANASSGVSLTTNGGKTYAGGFNDGSSIDIYVNALTAAKYDFALQLAAGDAQWNAQSITVKLDDATVATVNVTASTGWENFIEHAVNNISIASAGVHKITFVTNGGSCNISDFTVTKVAGSEEEFYTVTNIPGTVEVESFAEKSENIKINANGYAGETENGSFLKYYIRNNESGDYKLTLNLAAGDTRWNAESISVKLDNKTVATVPVNGSTGWETFIAHTADFAISSTGLHTLTLTVNGGACNINDFSFAKITDTPAGDDVTLESFEGQYTWGTEYKYQKECTVDGASSDHKYLVLTYTGDITSMRLQKGPGEGGKVVWFAENNEGSFRTANNEIVPAVGNNTTVVIDLQKSGIDASFFSDFHVHTGDTGAAGSVNILSAYLTETNPTPTDVENAKDNAEYIIVNGRNITLQSNGNAAMTIVNIYGQIIARNAQSAEMPAAGVYIVITENGKTKVYVK
ncbi:MAG: glycosyl hydrolase family 18 protein [Bacteroidales bacterium]|nr:glycosyl hydrolase family 18 protein [Bacteroidales bacterium]